MAIRAIKKSTKKAMEKTLILVESPTKSKTIEKYLGRGYIVRASMGHLRDLPKSQFGIDVDNNFEPKYINIRGKGDLIKALKKDAKSAKKIYLASDPDREGEAIAWHLAHILDVDISNDCRIVFNEITKPAIKEAVEKPRPINLDMVDAQQARRLLDRIVGYKLSPLLWRKIRKGLSAGRVQSVTVKMICEREKEIEAFVSEEYWSMGLKFRKDKSPMFSAELTKIAGEKLSVDNESKATEIAQAVKKGVWQVTDVKEKERLKKPLPPFTTSSLQQEAARKLGFTSRKTMMVAQQLYEGISIGKKGSVGLITYMRTDSTRISELAQNDARAYLVDTYGESYIPPKPNVYSASKKAQDAHEAIRPTNVSFTPDGIRKSLNADQLKLYKLIWQRFLASQMVPAIYDAISVRMDNAEYHAKATGLKLKFSGYTRVYTSETKEKEVVLPALAVGDELKLARVLPKQHFTEPPPRYNEASLVKTLEEKGIGRPSTYAPIIETVIARGYVLRSQKQFVPTELGYVVVDMLKQYFKAIVDEKFTADMENKLDMVAEGSIDKNDLLREFYEPFSKDLAEADEAIGHVELPVEVSDVKCDLCGRMMVVKHGRFGKFLACPGFPECRNTRAIIKEIGVKCPKCGGSIIERKSRRSRVFYGCKNYPECDYITWDMPQEKPCEKCGALVLKHFYKNGRGLLYCSNDNCETRINHPINKEIEKQRKKEAEKALAIEEKANE